jgi:predicted DNA-binding helix-hairpin-helix protein
MPGSSDAAVERAVSLASAVSLNIETAGAEHFGKLSASKDYTEDVIHPIKLISALTAKGSRFERVKQTTQFIVGASDETDSEIVKYSWGLYRRLGLDRVYFSAYQRGLGEPDIPGENSSRSNEELLVREHRLYQTDWLIRKYGFGETEIPFDANGNLHTDVDPKEAWARQHREFFPVNINRAGRNELLRVPGLGYVTVDFILSARKNGARLNSIFSLGKLGKRFEKAAPYISF